MSSSTGRDEAIVTAGQQYDEGIATFEREVANLLRLEAGVAGDLDMGIAVIARNLVDLATAYAERVESVRRSREEAVRAADALNELGRSLGRLPAATVPSSRVSAPPDGRRVHRAVGRGLSALVRELADAAASRATKEE